METGGVDRASVTGTVTAYFSRIAGPGTLYNTGNLIGLISGIAFAISAGEAKSAIAEYLVGDPGAIALTVAMVVFFISGECYRKVPATSPERAEALLRRADFLSGIGALTLSVALFWYGDYLLAIVSTALLAGGKFGNALSRAGSLPVRLEVPWRSATHTLHIDLYRLSVVLSRFPAMLGLAKTILIGLSDANASTLQAMILFLCYLLWLFADLLLMRRPG